MSTQQTGGFPFENFLPEILKYYNPITYWQHFFSPQTFIGCNIEDEDTEYQVLQEVGSYGKQLGTIIKVLDVLIDQPTLKVNELNPNEQAAVTEFQALSHGVHKAVEAIEGPKARRLKMDIDSLMAGLKEMAATDEQACHLLVEELKSDIDTLKPHYTSLTDLGNDGDKKTPFQ